MMTTKKGNGSKVEKLPTRACSNKYIWHMRVLASQPYNPDDKRTEFYFLSTWSNA